MPVGLITGASRGFGRALARALAGEGWQLIIDARDSAALGRASEEMVDVAAIAGDIADPAHRRDLAAAVSDIGRLDLLVNNASTLGPTPLPGLDLYPLDALADVLAVNTIAPLGLIQLVLPALTSVGGAIVNVTSDAAVEAYPGWGGYGASKAALEQLSSVLAAERPGVGVYWFDPGDMRTDMHQAAFPGEDISDRASPESVVPALLRLVSERPPNGRYRATDLLVPAVS